MQGGTTKKKKPEAKNNTEKKAFPVIGIGASAGGLEALETFFSHMPSDSGMAFVVIQHLAPRHKSILGDILKKDTQMNVLEIQDGMKIEPNQVYLNPPDKDVALSKGTFHLAQPSELTRVRMPIDFCFRSLAEDQREKAVCIILSGTGSDGTLGLEEVKAAGGLTLAQAEEQAKYPFMPRSAIVTGQVDYILPVEKMPEELLRYAKHPYLGGPAPIPAKQFQTVIQKILMLMRTSTKHDFTHYKPATIRRRIERRCRVTVTDISNLRAAERELRRHRDHLEQLVLERTASLEETVQKLRHEMAERRQAEAEIKRMASFPQLNPSPVLEIDVTGAITYYNQAAVAAVEKLGAEARLKDFLPEDLEEIQTAARQRGEGRFYREVSIADAVFAEHIYFAEPFDVLRVYTIDITPRKQAEEALRLSEARHRSFFQDSHAVMLVLDPKTGGIVDANPAACFFYGYTKEELTARQIADINTLARDQVFDEMKRASTGECRQFSFRHRLANGEVRDVEVFSGPVQFHGKTLLFSIIHDVTARKHAEAALRDREAKYRAVVETSADGFCISDMAGRFLEFNDAFADLLGYSREELLTMSVPDIEAQKTPAEVAAAIEKVRREGHVIFETRHRSKDGRVWPAEVNLAYWPIAGGRMFFFVRDITERKRAEEALRRAHDELEQRVLERTAELRLAVEHLQEEITQRQRAEESLARHAALVRDLYNNAPCGYHSLDPEGRFVQVNHTELAWLGYTREEMLGGMQFSDLLTADS